MQVIRARNVEHALLQGLAALTSYGVQTNRKGKTTIEMPCPVATVYERPTERVLFNTTRNANPFFHFFESLWILAGRDDVAFLAYLLPRMAEYSDNGVSFHGAYGHRLRHWRAMPDISSSYEHTEIIENEVDQIKGAIEMLKHTPDTRQCVLSIWDPELDLGTQTKDMPCNDAIAFSRSGADFGTLNMTVFNRSNDAIWGCYGANAVQFSMIHEYVASHVGCDVGTYTQFSNNFHAYVDNPFWQKYSSSNNQIEGYVGSYSLNEVTPYNLFAEPTAFDDDLKTFFEVVWQWDTPPAVVEWQSEAFECVVYPMWQCFAMHKGGLTEDAILGCMSIGAADWRKACTDWLARIVAARKAG